ncbi:related to DNA excision repair (Rad26L) [Lecanosticta acicola]|uniref:Related to DNA excision repair (Rad26L) n=1 Tax=Lecanosticta acicola TaxID=111012 RepID=A0AAI8Z2J9_9PEZI|nr:related to DNA excision repair (Rad26L) [Lecanosticta acicola]
MASRKLDAARDYSTDSDLNIVSTRTRVTFSDDDDIIAPPKKKRKWTERRRPKQVGGKKKVAPRGSMVGLKKTKTTHTRTRVSESDDDDEDEPPDEQLPQYLKDRMKTRDDLQNEGALLPPNYDDIDFPQDMSTLIEKPDLPGLEPPRPYEDTYIGWNTAIIPAPIAQYLKPYQVEGAEFLYKKFLFQKGGILGDDMGLGKTIQVIAFLTAAFGKTGDEQDGKRMRKVRKVDDRWYPRILLICPGTLMANWQSELDRWGWWHTYLFHGTATEKQSALDAAEKGYLEIMITTYDSYRNSQGAINTIRWDCVIADECHRIKEPRTAITKAMSNVNALCRLGLSGTAIQNKYEELWALLNWCSPGALGPMVSWKNTICMPLKLGQSHDATLSQLSKARRIANKLVKHLLPQFFLRRTKALIAHQLPKKSDRVIFCPLTQAQADAYNNFCDHELVHTIRDSSKPCYCGSGKKQGWCCVQEVEDFGRWQLYPFPVLATLQKLSNHLGLLVPSAEEDKEKHDKEKQRLEIAMPGTWEKLYNNRDNLLTYANTEYCGKWKVLKKLLRLWHDNGDKVLIFSHSVRFLTMLRTLFNNTDYNVSYLDGNVPFEDRQPTVDEYNADPSQFVFLISTKAGGVGLNITSANKVVVMDPNWNPAYDLQAQDRAYRIGQTRDVEVFRLVSVGTVEEIVYARQIYKQQQANIGYNASVERRYFKGVQDQKDQKGEIFGLTNLFAPVKENVVLRDIVNKTNIAETRAGVEITGLDFEASQEDEDESAPFNPKEEDAAMSQLAAEIIDEPGARRQAAKETAKKKDPVQAILASAGVEYTHENAEVIGTSKIETKISSRAQKAGNDVEHINELAFARGLESQSQQRPGSEYVYRPQQHGASMADDDDDDDAVDLDDGLGKVRYKYRPPVDVRKRQFCTMAKDLGYDDVTEFALVVEGWTQEERRNCLEKFYLKRRAKLAGQRV